MPGDFQQNYFPVQPGQSDYGNNQVSMPIDYGAYINEQSRHGDDLIRWEIDSSIDIKELKGKFLGLQYSPDNDTYVKPKDGVAYPLMNLEGAEKMCSIITTHVNKNTVLTHYTDDQINLLMRCLLHEVTSLILTKHQDYNIAVKEAGAIYVMIQSFVYSSLLRSLLGGERIFQGRINKNIVTKTENINQNAPKQGWRLF